MRGMRRFMPIERNISNRGKCRSAQMQLSPNFCLKFRWLQKQFWNKSYTTNALKCNASQIQHHHLICLALRFWNRTWGMFLQSTWGLLKSWRAKASSCLNVWALLEMLFRTSRVMTFRVSVLYWDELRYICIICDNFYLQIHLKDHIH